MAKKPNLRMLWRVRIVGECGFVSGWQRARFGRCGLTHTRVAAVAEEPQRSPSIKDERCGILQEAVKPCSVRLPTSQIA